MSHSSWLDSSTLILWKVRCVAYPRLCVDDQSHWTPCQSQCQILPKHIPARVNISFFICVNWYSNIAHAVYQTYLVEFPQSCLLFVLELCVCSNCADPFEEDWWRENIDRWPWIWSIHVDQSRATCVWTRRYLSALASAVCWLWPPDCVMESWGWCSWGHLRPL